MKKLCSIINKYFYFILGLTMTIGFIANYRGRGMSGILSSYIDFARLIKSGFSIKINFPTFPMWGYGFVYAVTDNKFLILVLQFCISFFTIYILDKLAQQTFKSDKVKVLFRFFLIFSFPWFSFNSLLWPYSIAANFTILSLIFLYKCFDENKNYYLFVSACLFGVVLNFRSDYYLYPIFLVILFAVYKLYSWKNKLPTKTKMHYVCLWLVLIYTFLIPYAIYTKTVTDHYLITSTNSGHVLFIGLGQLPNNKWGITPYDEDPKMAKIMEDELGQKDYGYNLQYEGDKILKKHFLNMIKEDPLEYTKKVFYSTYLMLKGGFYSGEYQAWVISGEEEKQIHMEVKESLKKIDLENIFVIFKKEGLFFALLYTLQKLINIYSRLLFAFFNLLLLFFLYKKFYQSNCFISIIFLSIVFYQFALCIFAYYMLIYITNLYLIYLFFIFWAIDCHIENKREKPF